MIDHGSATFDTQILYHFFDWKYGSSSNLIQGRFWKETPAGLQHKYLLFRLDKKDYYPGLFPELFLPVFEFQLSKQDVRNKYERDARLRQWLQFLMHQHWHLGWVLTNHTSRGRNVLHNPLRLSEELQYHSVGETESVKEMIRVENDARFLNILCAIVEDDQEAVLEAFHGTYIGVDDLNYCFGTTLIGFAIAHGTPRMLKLLLTSTTSVPRKHVYVYLRLAIARSGESGDFTSILLDRLSGFDTAKKIFALDVLQKAISGHDTSFVPTIVRWIQNSAEFPGRLQVMDWLIKHTATTSRNNSIIPSRIPKLLTSTLDSHDLIPQFMLDGSYDEYLAKSTNHLLRSKSRLHHCFWLLQEVCCTVLIGYYGPARTQGIWKAIFVYWISHGLLGRGWR